jgi:hypothetical protein
MAPPDAQGRSIGRNGQAGRLGVCARRRKTVSEPRPTPEATYAASGRDIQRMSGIAGSTQPRPATT